MLPYPDRFRFKSAPPKASRLMFLWLAFLLLVAVLSVGMLVTAIVQAAETEPNQDVRAQDATSGTLLFKAETAICDDGGIKCWRWFLQQFAIQPARW